MEFYRNSYIIIFKISDISHRKYILSIFQSSNYLNNRINLNNRIMEQYLKYVCNILFLTSCPNFSQINRKR